MLLVTLDTTRADHLSCYGGTGVSTPRFDQLAAQGTRFLTCTSTSAVTPVSHASILTGRENAGHGLRVLAADGGYRLPEDVPTLASVLHARGYRTLAVHSAFPVSDWFGFARDFDVFESFEASVEVDELGAKWDGSHQRRSDDTTDLVLELLRDQPEPWFLWIHYWDPHDADLVPPPRLLPPELPRFNGKPHRSDALYAIEVAWVDRQFGRVLDALDANQQAARTIVAVTADHGEGLADGERLHGWQFHREVYREQLQVPLILRGPGVPTGVAVEGLTGTIDIAPTLLELCDAPLPAGIVGTSLVAAMRGARLPERTLLADQINGYDLNAKMLQNRPWADFVYAAIERDWKLVYRPMHPERSELFRLSIDPLEEHNVFSEHPAEVKRLLEVLAAREPWVTAPFADGGAPSPESLAILESLGYAGGGGVTDPGVWGWTCPGEDTIHDERGTCPETGLPMIPVRRNPGPGVTGPADDAGTGAGHDAKHDGRHEGQQE